jgi:hypothetical protein
VERFQTILEGTAPVRRLDKVPGGIYRTLNTAEALAPKRFGLPTFSAVTCKDAFDITCLAIGQAVCFWQAIQALAACCTTAKDHLAVDIAHESVPNAGLQNGR